MYSEIFNNLAIEQSEGPKLKDNAKNVFDFTCPTYIQYKEGKVEISIEDIKNWCTQYGKHWAFQLEKGMASGYLHYQGRISLVEKLRLSTLITLVKKPAAGNCMLTAHFSYTHTSNTRCFDYVIKEATRVDGPWTDKDPKPKVLTDDEIEDLKMLEDNAYPFQNSVLEISQIKDRRRINVIFGPTGGDGKSTICNVLDAKDIALIVPPLNNYKELIQYVASMMEFNPKKCCIFDMPRSINKDTLYQLYAAIETVKSGKVFDTRYKGRQVKFNSPVIWVFTNIMPDVNMLSKDRWVYWKINSKKELVPLTVAEEVPRELIGKSEFMVSSPIVVKPNWKISIKTEKLEILEPWERYIKDENGNPILEM